MRRANLIATGTLALLEHPDQMEKLRREPSLISSAVEELLRYSSPVFMSTERYAREDIAIRDVAIRRGEMTLGVIGSANRDEAVFENPEALDITRENNKHLAVRDDWAEVHCLRPVIMASLGRRRGLGKRQDAEN